MKFIPLYTIKSRLTLNASSILLIYILIGFTSFYFLNRIVELSNLSLMASSIFENVREMEVAERNIIVSDQNSEYFYHSGKSENLDKFERQYNFIFQNLTILSANENIQSYQIQTIIKDFKLKLIEYRGLELNIVKAIRNRGYINYGLIGEMTDIIENQENEIRKLPNNSNLLEFLLTMRSLEKDYLSQKSLKFKDNLFSTINSYKKALEQFNLDQIQKSIFLNEIENYRSAFERIAHKEIEISIQYENGFTGNNLKIKKEFESLLVKIVDSITSNNNIEINNAKNYLIVFIIIFLILVLFLTISMGRSITYQLQTMKHYIFDIVKGKLPKKIILKRKDEIESVFSELNKFVENMQEKILFSTEIGNGNLQVSYNPVTEDDALGIALTQMQKSLVIAEEKEELRKNEEAKQTWTAIGLSRFGDILREQHLSLNDLSFKVISELANYLNISQCGIFIVNDENPQDIHLELLAAYAYNREKKLKKKIKFKEGIVGICAVEKVTTYLNDIPDDYFKITSGLGQTKPNYILVVPLMLNENLFGVLEIASLNEIEEYKIKFIEKFGENISSTFSTIKSNQRTADLLDLARRQAEGITSQEEELRVNTIKLQELRNEIKKKKIETENLATRLKEKEEAFLTEILKNNEFEIKYSELTQQYKSNLDDLQQNRKSLHALQEELLRQENEIENLHKKIRETEKILMQNVSANKELEDAVAQKKRELELTKEQIDRVISTDKSRMSKLHEDYKKQINLMTDKSKNTEHELKMQINDLLNELEKFKKNDESR